jgi:hypothetical protein
MIFIDVFLLKRTYTKAILIVVLPSTQKRLIDNNDARF